MVKALPKITKKGISKNKAGVHELLTPSFKTGPFHLWPSFHTVALLQSVALDFNDFVLSSAFSEQGEGWCGCINPFCHCMSACQPGITAGTVLSAGNVIRKAQSCCSSLWSLRTDVCLLILTVHTCVFMRERQRQRQKESQREREEIKHNDSVWPGELK